MGFVFQEWVTGNFPLLQIAFTGEVVLDSCEFTGMTSLRASPVTIEADGSLSITMKGTVKFDGVIFSDRRFPLIEVVRNNQISLSLTGATVSNCVFSKLVSGQVTTATLEGCEFTGCTGQLISANSVSLTDCEFTGNSAGGVDESLISVSGS